ncbi:DUF1120 domain-containing protein [Pseudomonas sp. dw_358]|uniref:DUF1120 domain-containing protein n=1 Tax=Pseudomonas sp. dw_358 TaxID=2720083 RepID=UPI001BD1D111|nr:DUF1120 domain-containing protein [Pseudomonas sp. dw_358]
MNIQKTASSALLGVSLMAGSAAFAATAADLSVTGILSPRACEITLAYDFVDLGAHLSRDLSLTEETDVGEDITTLDVHCDAPTLFALSAVDNALGSAYRKGDNYYGLGLTDSGEPIGYYTVRLNRGDLMGDGVSVLALGSTDKITWTGIPVDLDPGGGADDPWAGYRFSHGDNYLAFGVPGPAVVSYLSHLTTTLWVHGFIAPRQKLTLSDEVELEGNVTFEVVYL